MSCFPKLIPFFKVQGNHVIGMSGNSESTLATHSSYHLNVSVSQEACPLQLAPTSSTTASLVMGDALAVALMTKREFQANDFAQFHPGGRLGRRLLATVGSVMRSKRLPILSKTDSIEAVIQSITEGQCGLVVIIEDGAVLGVITDGDIRRAMQDQSRFFTLTAQDIMTIQPKWIRSSEKLVTAHERMTQHKINTLLVMDDNECFVGVIQVYDLGI